ncbi:hypothetical protein [Streptomyces agglomeratus]|uniref:hypothetical protein n=2 Tax=Streptomyces agglomeratus TaxID=285458 RepID=UPI00210AD0D2|nr:hypothetical protein [Streptomyces agglomeratus]
MPGLNMRTCTLFETTTDMERLRQAEAFVASGLYSGAFQHAVDRTFSWRRSPKRTAISSRAPR